VQVDVVGQLYHWTDLLLWYALAALRLWALLDCLMRKTAAFPAVQKLTKPAWVAILAISGVIGTFASPPAYPLSLISAVVAAVYLADVRPAVREVSGGR
jgi:hypothetical protein